MKRDFHIGPGAASLILIIVILSMSVLSVLALTNARSDERLTVRSANVVEAVAQLNAEAERSFADLDGTLAAVRNGADTEEAYLAAISASLPEGMALNGNNVEWTTVDEDGRKLYCAVEVLPLTSETRCTWKQHRLSSEFAEMELEDIWN